MAEPSMWWVPLAQSAIQAAGVVMAASIGLLLWRRGVRQEREKQETRLDLERRERNHQRRIRVHEVLIAMRADIQIDCEHLARIFPEDVVLDHAGVAAHRLPTSGMPRTVTAPGHIVLDALRSELALLPEEVIASSVRFMRKVQWLDKLAEALSSGLFDGHAEDARRAVLTSYATLGRECLAAGHDAVLRIDSHLERNREAHQ